MKSQSGNALFLILIAIFLLGGLTVLLSRSGTQTDETGDVERASITANEMLRYTAALGAQVQRLISSGCSENELSFYSNKWTTPADYENADELSTDVDTNFNCFVYDTRGAGYPWKEIPEGVSNSATEYYITGTIGIKDVGTTGYELVLIAPDVRQEVCSRINASLSVNSFASDSYTSAQPFQGSYGTGTTVTFGVAGTNPSYVVGKKAACMEDGGGNYFFYQVLHAR
ncbi:MAG: hypothetical protein DI551_02530 [Micavibrio aeruginosavorus]|uniref:Uncharacterized protein n=1 Tax=Micavibrio aeruginosavorus TaxID=349221 RepID=A0A2W5N5I1_9BACT|nr:MAG: hypothetical protein DI551_02530 [Micavibrio aeruginosavorus]